jgi:hypothetical protein
MFDKIGQLAEAAANSISVSRRGFLGRLGNVALGAAGVLGGLLVLPGTAQAGSGVICCKYECKQGYACPPGKRTFCYAAGTICPPNQPNTGCLCKLTGSQSKDACTQC